MVAQKRKEKISAEIFGIFDCLLPQNPSNQSALPSWLFKTKWKTKSQNPKTGGSSEIFLPENDFKSCSRVHLLAYPDWATFPRFPRVGLFMAVFSAFFHLDWSCTILGAIFHKQKSSVTDSFHVCVVYLYPDNQICQFRRNVLSSLDLSLHVHTI